MQEQVSKGPGKKGGNTPDGGTKVVVPETGTVMERINAAIREQDANVKMDIQQKQQVTLKPPKMRRICACGSLTCPDGPWYGWMFVKG